MGVVDAAELDGVTIRLNRMKTEESPLPILVMVKKRGSASVNGIRLTVGTYWQVDTDLANFKVSTTGLPSGVSPLSGLTVSQISGQRVTMSVNNFSNNATYGFWITGGVGINPAVGDDAGYRWQVETTNGGSQVETMEEKVPIYADDTVKISGVVGANASDFQLDINPDKTSQLSDGDVVTYTINFGSYLPSALKPLVISAGWSRGTVDGSASPTVDIVNYVVGSGSTGYGDVSPVVDLANNKISWTFDNFPANTVNQSVTFQLRVDGSNYTGMNDVLFDTTAYLYGAGVITMNKSISGRYHPPQATPTPTMTPTDTPTPTPTPPEPTGTLAPGATATPTPPSPTEEAEETVTPVPEKIKIWEIQINQLLDSKVVIEVETNTNPSKVKINYGASIDALNQSVTSLSGNKEEFIAIDGLVAGTDYYFRVEASDAAGNKDVSDLITFKTSTSSVRPEAITGSAIVTAGDNVLWEEKNDTGDGVVVIIPSSDYAIKLNLKNSEIIKTARLVVRNAKILGEDLTIGMEANSGSANLIEINNGVFSGHLTSPTEPGFYEVFLRTTDSNGNIAEVKVAEIRVVPPLKVVDEKGSAIENAKVELYSYNAKDKIYIVTEPEHYGFPNPGFTKSDGTLDWVLPKGKYRVEVSEIGFEYKQVDFVIGSGVNEVLPKVVMSRAPVTLGKLWTYYNDVGKDSWLTTQKFMLGMATSTRFFKLTAIWVTIFGMVSLWIFLSRWNSVWWWALPERLWVSIKSLVQKKENGVSGWVLDEMGQLPIKGAEVYLLSGSQNEVLSKTKTDISGRFVLEVKPSRSYRLAASKPGFETTPLFDFTTEGLAEGNLVVKMERIEKTDFRIELKILTKIVDWIMTTMLVGLFLIELFFWKNLGWSFSWPWVVISWVAMLMWLHIKLGKNNE